MKGADDVTIKRYRSTMLEVPLKYYHSLVLADISMNCYLNTDFGKGLMVTLTWLTVKMSFRLSEQMASAGGWLITLKQLG